jgi:hypothetical protein
MSLPAGLIGALMGGGPIPLPSIACALCLAIVQDDTNTHPGGPLTNDPFVNQAKTLAAGWLVCAFHAEVLAHQLAESNYTHSGGFDTINPDGTRRPLADSFTLPPAVMG